MDRERTNTRTNQPTNQPTTERTNGGIFVTYFANYCTNLDAHSSIISSDEHHPAWSHGLHPIHGTSFAATERLRLGTCEPLAALLLILAWTDRPAIIGEHNTPQQKLNLLIWYRNSIRPRDGLSSFCCRFISSFYSALCFITIGSAILSHFIVHQVVVIKARKAAAAAAKTGTERWGWWSIL